MNGRYFDGRKVEAGIYDGVTKYGMSDKQETEEDEKKRLEKYEKWLLSTANESEKEDENSDSIESFS